ncbi:MAG TPA: glucans biosynthesis glucosyltransferase MdoH [Steroidobacteraceae bacterium]|nr:glucans biosynthesis glucosyltransferase MdoH [Steroidobacteraceae bacterium]
MRRAPPIGRSRWRTGARRGAFFVLTLLTGVCASALLHDVLAANGMGYVERLGLGLFFLLFTWISGALWTAIAGFLVRLAGGDPAGIDPREVQGRPLHGRIAIAMPIHNEDVRRVAAGLEAVWTSLAREAEAGAFDLFILSDTSDAQIAVAEELMWERLVEAHEAQRRIFYRRRLERSQRKAGNIADFVRRWGGNYECMVVLDADSVMTGGALVTLARLMEAHPQIGILQSLPLPMGRRSLFGRLIQFGSRLQSPMLTSGLAYWHLGESNYYGHNAIVRLRPWTEYCELPVLSGRPPLGGDILSHDFVEAAFMRRAGYEVRQLPDLGGSWEEVPANVIDYAARDRRWTQGNLQHARVLFLPGLHPMSRLHFLTGIMAYLSSPMWLALLLLSSLVSVREAAKAPSYFLSGFSSLFPLWPQMRHGETTLLFAITVMVLLLPKVLAAILAIRDPQSRRQFGGAGRVCASLLLEQFFSVLLAPAMMVFHSTFVMQTLLGRTVAWNAQDRSDRGVSLREAFARQKWQLVLGLLWGAALLFLARPFFWWLSPVLVGLVCGIGLTVWTSHASAGELALRLRLLLVPEETEPPEELIAVSMRRSSLSVFESTPPRSHSGAVQRSGECSLPPTGRYGKLPLAPVAEPCERPQRERVTGEQP